jgi:pSer/pThr/pTyr-binding forkhead associated (FHA) protein
MADRPIYQASGYRSSDRSRDESTQPMDSQSGGERRRDMPGDGVVDVPIEATETMPHVPTQSETAGGAAGGAVSLPYGMALLVVSHGPNIGARFLLDRDLIVAGRHPDSDIFLDDVTVSRSHAEFRRLDDRFVLADTGSLNGTYVNRERVPQAELRNGDEIQIGKFRLTFIESQPG